MSDKKLKKVKYRNKKLLLRNSKNYAQVSRSVAILDTIIYTITPHIFLTMLHFHSLSLLNLSNIVYLKSVPSQCDGFFELIKHYLKWSMNSPQSDLKTRNWVYYCYPIILGDWQKIIAKQDTDFRATYVPGFCWG